ncbi:ArsB/NhaD family transporter [Peribacillus simplex]
MLWRPFGINETIPTAIGALTLLVAGIVPWMDVLNIFDIIIGASLTILSTIMMSIVLESIGFFRWIALNIIIRSKGSGVRLFADTNLLCLFLTMFFNNDGSILITTPIIIHIVTLLKIKPHQKIPFLNIRSSNCNGSECHNSSKQYFQFDWTKNCRTEP